MRREVKVGNVRLDAKARKAVLEVMANDWISPGPFVEKFEKAFAKAHDREYGVMVNSGTDALRIALMALKEQEGWGDSREILVPALTFVATVNVILQCTLKPVFVDVSPLDLNMDTSLISKEITFKTAGIIPVHMFGNMADLYGISYIATQHKLRMIEDSCETMGVRFTGDAPHRQSVGSFGDIACFSTYACHLIQTGVGGMAVTSHQKLNDLMRSYMNHGRRSETRNDRFVFDRIGFSSRPDEFQAAIGLSQLEALPKAIKARRSNAWGLYNALQSHEADLWMLNPLEVQKEKAWMMFPIILNDKTINRDVFCHYLAGFGIETRPLFPLLTQPCYKSLHTDSFYAERFPVALNASLHGFYVGCHPDMTEEDVEYVARYIRTGVEAFSSRGGSVAVA